jgi:F0F1-type ATP synthase membrane subunit b/b'
MLNLWKFIVETNTFNFFVLLIVFVILFQKLNIANTIEQLKQDIIKTIEDAKSKREAAKLKLANAKELSNSTNDDVEKRLKDAHSRAEDLSKQIAQSTKSNLELIEKSFNNAIRAEEKKLSAQMSEQVLNQSIKLAKKQIIEALKENPQLHNKLIEESIGEI